MLKINSFIYGSIITVFVLISLIPFNYLPLKVFGFPFHHLFLGSSILFLMFLSWLNVKKFTSFDKWLIFLLFCFCLTLITSLNRTYTLHIILGFIFKAAGVAFVMERVFLNRKKNFTKIILICASLISVIGIIEYIGLMGFKKHLNPWSKLILTLTDYSFGNMTLSSRSGMSSTIGHPNPLAAYLVMLVPLSVYYFQEKTVVFRTFPFFVVTIAVFLSFSRSSWVGYIVALGIYFSFNKNLRSSISKWKIYFSWILVVAAMFLTFPQMRNIFFERINFQTIKSEILYSHRAASYKTTLKVLKKYPILGVGLGNYPEIHESYRDKDADPRIKTTDNIYLRYLCEIGLVGTTIVMSFFFYWFYKLWQNRDNGFIFAIFCGLLGFMFNQVAVDLFYWTAPNFLFWMLFGIAVSTIESKEVKSV